MPTIKPDWYCIVNPHAGSGKTMSEWAIAEKCLTSLKVQYKTTLTNYQFHATKLSYEAAQHGYRKILAVGGDGSVHETLNGIMQYCDEYSVSPEDFTLAVIPIGSGNDWIKSTNVPHDTRKVCELIAASSFGRQDIVRVHTTEGISYMANIGGAGFDSFVSERVNRLKEMGKRSSRIYLNALIYTILHLKPFDTVVSADGVEVFRGSIFSIAFGNGRYSGGGMMQVPVSELDDGLLDYTIFPKYGLLQILSQVPKLYKGTLHKSPYFPSGKCHEIEVSGNCLFEADGESKGNLPLRIEMTGQQINILKGKR